MKYAHYKRFFENYNADPAFRDAYHAHPQQTVATYALDVEPQAISEILSIPAGQEHLNAHPYYQERFRRELPGSAVIDELRSLPIRNAAFHHWRQRQMNRLKALCHAQLVNTLPHFPIVFELSEGCSGQCPFCCFAPPPLQRIFADTAEHRRLWRDILEASAGIIGPLAKYAICYYATEPFDHPDYEAFARDFQEMFDWWPPLTTSKALADPARIRRYLHMLNTAGASEQGKMRFSVTSLPMLRQVHAEYSAEEAEHILFVLNNPESLFKYTPAGRARELRDAWEREGRECAEKFYQPGVITCASGFIVNLAARSIRLVSPCNPDEAHPYGYITFGTASFHDAADYEAQLMRLIEQQMPEFPEQDRVLAFQPPLRFEIKPDGIVLSTRFLTRQFHGDEYMIRLGQYIHESRYTWNNIRELFDNLFITEYYLRPKVRALFEAGALREDSFGAVIRNIGERE